MSNNVIDPDDHVDFESAYRGWKDAGAYITALLDSDELEEFLTGVFQEVKNARSEKERRAIANKLRRFLVIAIKDRLDHADAKVVELTGAD